MEMGDEIDVYLSRNLKNWAALHRPPLEGRARLMKAILFPPPGRPKSHLSDFIRRLLDRVNPPVHSWVFYGDRPMGPMTQSRFWAWHFAADLRLTAS
jgi:hypothetical protein